MSLCSASLAVFIKFYHHLQILGATPFCTMSVGCYSNTPRVLMAPSRVLKHIKHPGDVTVTPQGVAAKFRVQDAAVKNSNIATQLLSLLLVHFKSGSNYICSFESILGRFSTSTATFIGKFTKLRLLHRVKDAAVKCHCG